MFCTAGNYKERWCTLESDNIQIFEKFTVADGRVKPLYTVELAGSYLVHKPEDLKLKFDVDRELTFLIHSPDGKVSHIT